MKSAAVPFPSSVREVMLRVDIVKQGDDLFARRYLRRVGRGPLPRKRLGPDLTVTVPSNPDFSCSCHGVYRVID
jgi:hypothetical protein